jgi:beta-N-acetylhexosaminidase
MGTKPAVAAYHATGEAPGGTLLLIFTDDSRSDSGRLLDQQLRHRIPDTRVMYVDLRTARDLTPTVLSAAAQSERVIAAVYEVPVAGKIVRGATGNGNSVAVPSASASLLQQVLQAATAKTVVIAMGNPYIISQFPDIQTYLCTYSNMKVSENSAVKAIFGEIPFTGHLPVSIPDIAPRGVGLSQAAQRSTGGSQ